jgi:hypothetical protein
MAALFPDHETPEEALVHWLIASTWVLWIVGATYHAYAVVPWVLAGLAFMRRFGLLGDDPESFRPLPMVVWLWFTGMATMAVALIIGHLNHDFGTLEIIKSLFGWAKGWAVMAILPFAGATLKIRPQVLFRAVNLLAAQTLLVAPLLILGSVIGLPMVLYTSPLYYIGGASETFFQVGTHWVDPGSPDVRYRFYAPWGPAAAFSAQMMMVIGLYDKDWRWRIVAVLSACVVCFMAKSRLSLVAIPVILIVLPVISQLYRPAVMAIGGVLTATMAMAFPAVTKTLEEASDRFKGARKDSSRVRKVLQDIAVHRWWNEAPWFGHGTVERGPHLVEFMPIGSHHTWNGLLFVKGAVGWASLAVPMLVSLIVLVPKAQRDPMARAAIGVLLVIFFNSFGENIEILAYLAWPGFLALGMAFKRRRIGLFAELLGPQRKREPRFS